MNREDLSLGRAFDAYQSFLLGMKLQWTRDLSPRLRARYQHLERHSDGESTTPEHVSALFEHAVDYAYYAWSERHLQRMKYSGRFGLTPVHERHRTTLETWLDSDLSEGLLTLDPEFEPHVTLRRLISINTQVGCVETRLPAWCMSVEPEPPRPRPHSPPPPHCQSTLQPVESASLRVAMIQVV